MSDGIELGTDSNTDSEPQESIESLVDRSGVESTIETAKVGFENFGKDRVGSTAFGWIVAATLAAELEPRLAAEAEADADPSQGSVAESNSSIAALSNWIDESLSHKDPETVTLHRITKLGEESGEVFNETIGAFGANPRKGIVSDFEKVKEELLDVAVTALGAYEHLDGQGRSVSELLEKIKRVTERAGLTEDAAVENVEDED